MTIFWAIISEGVWGITGVGSRTNFLEHEKVTEIVTIEAPTKTSHSMPPVPIGMRQFGRYTMIYRFASGGMANLYLGRLSGSDGFERLVAIKVIHDHLTSNAEFSKMFIDEARLVSRISHPNVVQVLDLGKVGPSYFIAMEYINGESVAAILRRTRLPIKYCARIIANTAAGLHAAHELCGQDGELIGVVHRDVSPHNMLVGYNGSVKVVDFGLARAKGSLHTSTDGTLKGKFGYMAPEQIAGEEVDRRADIFALGIVLYEITTYRRLFKTDSDKETLGKILSCQVEPPSQRVKGYPKELEQIVLKALQRNPERRYQTARQMLEDLEDFIVARGSSVLPHHIAQTMEMAFADRIEKKARLLEEFGKKTAGSIPDANVLSTLTDPQNEITQLANNLRKLLWGALMALVTMGAVVGMVLGLSRSPKLQKKPVAAPLPRVKDDKSPLRAPTMRHIKIEISATPSNATIAIDQQEVTNPYTYIGPPKNKKATIVVSAPGYEQKNISIDQDMESRWNIELHKLSKDTRSEEKHTRSSKRRKRKRAISDREVMANPYGD